MRANRNNYEVKITETKSRQWKKVAFDSTTRADTDISDLSSYILEHSPIRVEEYCIELKNIPVFVSTHYIRHTIGINPYVLTQRDDRQGVDEDGRWEETNHTMFVNAEAIMNIARKRLCLTSHKETVYIMNLIKKEMHKKNPDLAKMLVPNCVYRNGLCKEGRGSCGKLDSIMKKYSYYKELFV